MINQTKTLKKIMTISLLAIGAVILSLAPETYGGFVLTLDDLSTAGVDVIVVDNTDGGLGTLTGKGISTNADGSGTDGVVTFSGGVGSFIVNVTTGISAPMIGSPSMG